VQTKIQAMTEKLAAEVLSPGRKASETARWARIMTKWLITHSGKASVKWRLVEFGGITGSESRGIVDMLAIRKNHKEIKGVKRGDLFDIVLIQVKGGSAQRPSESDVERLRVVANYYHAKDIVLAAWKIKKELNLYRLDGAEWTLVRPTEVFG
jgi:hypothetical protein